MTRVADAALPGTSNRLVTETGVRVESGFWGAGEAARHGGGGEGEQHVSSSVLPAKLAGWGPGARHPGGRGLLKLSALRRGVQTGFGKPPKPAPALISLNQESDERFSL